MAGPVAELPFSGACTALITPFYEGKLDEAAFIKLVNS